MLKGLFKRTKCDNCGFMRDSSLQHCPKCERDKRELYALSNPLMAIDAKKTLLLGVVMVVVQVLVLIIAMLAIVMLGVISVSSGNAIEEDPIVLSICEAVASFAAIITGIIILRAYMKPLLFSAKKYKNILIGVGAGLALFGITYGYMLLTGGEDNENQKLLVKTFEALPALFGVSVVILAPLFEEIIFRVCVFGFLSRINKPLAYVASAISFALIHIDFTSGDLTTELLTAPVYVLAGFALTFAYDKFGFWSNLSLHATNNLASYVMMLLFI